MKRLLEIPGYVEDVRRVATLNLPWDKLRGKTILITGGTGLIGSFLIDALKNLNVPGRCKFDILVRSSSKIKTNPKFCHHSVGV